MRGSLGIGGAILVVALGLLAPWGGYAQPTIQEVERRLAQAQGDAQLGLMLQLGHLYLERNPERSLELGLKTAFLAKRGGRYLFEGQALMLMGHASMKLAQAENALRYYNRALALFERMNIRPDQVGALEGIATIYRLAGDYDISISYLQRALSIARATRRADFQRNVHLIIGDIAFERGDYALAYSEYRQVMALLAADLTPNPDMLRLNARLLRQNAFIYRNLGQLQKSLQAFTRAASIERGLSGGQLPVEYINQIAQAYLLVEHYDSALIYFNRALTHFKHRADTLGAIATHKHVGDVYLEMGLHRQAIASMNLSLRLANQSGNTQAQIAALVGLSRCFFELYDYPTATIYLNQALRIAQQSDLTASAAEVFKYLSRINESEGRYMQALEYYKMWTELQDSIYIQETGQQLAKLQILYEISQKERENEILRQNNEIQVLMLQKSRYQRVVFIALAISLFILLILLGILYRDKQREIRKQRETELKIVEINRELEGRMMAEIRKQEQQQLLLAQKSKLESLGTLAAGIAHEINQPLGGISMGLDNMLVKISDGSISEAYLRDKLSLLFDNVERIKRIINHIRTFSRAHKPAALERVNLNDVVSNALLMVRSQYENHNVRFRIEFVPNIDPIRADRIKLEQVLLNLLSNARYALDERERAEGNGQYEKTIWITTRMDEKNIYLTVRDNGTGISSTDLEKIFDPFFTTKLDDKGTGLGLAISYGFIKEIQGEIRVDSQEGEFTAFDISIPRR